MGNIIGEFQESFAPLSEIPYKVSGQYTDEDLICPHCNGSGEGMHDGTICLFCGGSGAECDILKDEREYDADEDYDEEREIALAEYHADLEHDRRRDNRMEERLNE